MTSSVLVSEPQSAHVASAGGGRQRVVDAPTNRVRRDGKFFRLGDEKFYVKGVTYGPFAANVDGEFLPSREQTTRDFAQMRELGANCLRIYHNPPKWFLDLAHENRLKIFLDVSWPKNLSFCDDHEIGAQAHAAVRESARCCGNHPAVFAISVVNEIPADIVRFCGARRIEQFIDELVATGKREAPQCLFTFANFPTTEYVNPREIDFLCFNVYLHDESALRNYLARLQNIAGEKPLMLGEYGIDTFREQSEDAQAAMMARQTSAVYEEGAVGVFVFSFTDDWHTHGYKIEDWAFGITRCDRSPKPAFAAVKEVFAKAPQATSLTLPKMSVVICSYNGASTTESCLRSMMKLRYPDFEVIFVDDGSTDNTQEILARFPSVINVKQKNMGLSFARNVGMERATGDVVVYTDSDCEADEDWLYYLAVSLVRSGYIGMGGPNLIPDEGSWVADCVGLSPGGPTHVMVDDRTAEHVPGCNMAFYRWALKQVNGFDPQYRKAGDDVDVIWRLQDLGYPIGFSPAAQVWHYRRNTIKAYLKQQRGYGEAEALLKYKHPDHFNTLGASHWRGKIYGADGIGIRIGGDVIYHGLFGTGLFQTIYRRPASLTVMMLMSIEWHLLTAFVAVLGLVLMPLLWVALVMFLTPIAFAAVAAWQAPRPRHPHWFSRVLIAYLHYRQPITRGWARYSVRLKNKILRGEARGYRRTSELPLDPNDSFTLRYWNKDHGRFALLDKVTEEIRAARWRIRADSGWNGWDMEIYASRYVKIQITTATEHHHHVGKLTRVRVVPKMSTFCMVLLAASTMLAVLLLVHLWPFSRIALLIPLIWWAMYAVNRWRVSNPVLGLIDHCAEVAGFYPVPAAKPKTAEPAEPVGVPQPMQSRNEAAANLPTDLDIDVEEGALAGRMTESLGVGRAYLRAARYFRDDWGKILFSTILIGLNTLAKLGQPFPMALLVDSVIDNKRGGDWVHRTFGHYAPASKLQQIIILAAATLALRGIQELLGLWQGMYNLNIGFNGLLRVRCDLYRKLQELSLSYHRNRPQGDAIYRLGTDTNGFQAAFNTVQTIFVNIIMLACMSVIMLGMNWKLGLCAVAIMPVLFWTMQTYGTVLMNSSRKAAAVEADLTTTVQRSVNSIGLVQAFGREDDEFARFHDDVDRSNRAWMRMHVHSMIYWLVIGLAFGCGTAMILGYGGWLAYQYSLGMHNGMTIGFLWVYLAYLTQLYDPLQKLSGSGVDLHRGMAGMLRVYEVLDTETTVRDDPHAVPLPRQPRVLALEHASFEYSPQARVLNDVSVSVRPGEMVAFVGPSGVGKSSLLNLLPRFYDPTAGRLTLDGHDLRTIKLRDLRQHIALVLQEYAILPTTVAENIGYGVPAAPPAVIRKAAELAGADHFIEALPQKYATILTENGQNLSGGQRQRISIARALATEAPILVLDEPTSALDAQNEQMITETLHSLKGKRTIVLVSHRLSTVFDCDRIFVMDAGKIVETGTHEQLLAMGGSYYRMAQHQLKLNDPDSAISEPGL